MKSPSCSLLFALLWVLRLVGAFPYRWRYLPGGQLEVRRSAVAMMWSWVVVVIVFTLSLTCVINAPDFHRGTTSTISTHILNYVTYLISAVFFPYLALRSPKLAHILSTMHRTNILLRQRVLDQTDVVQVVCMVGINAGLFYATYCSVSGILISPMTKIIGLYHIPSTICDVFIEITALTLGFLLYFLLKILSLESESALEVLAPPCQLLGKEQHISVAKWGTSRRPNPNRGPIRVLQISEGQVMNDYAQTTLSTSYGANSVDVCCGVSRRLLALDDIVVEVVEYAGPPVAMILLSSTVNATIMLYLTIVRFSNYYLAYITLKICSILQVTFIPDALWKRREEGVRLMRRLLITHAINVSTEAALKDVERVLETSAKFIVCRLFVLDRHIILSVASSVVTYLIIALQFGFSEAPRTPGANCTATDHLH